MRRIFSRRGEEGQIVSMAFVSRRRNELDNIRRPV
jgi:hypothetical protein